MFSLSVIDDIQDSKLRNTLKNMIEVICQPLSEVFDFYVDRMLIDSYMYDVDELVYTRISAEIKMVPRPDVVFISKQLYIGDIDLTNYKKVLRIPSKNNLLGSTLSPLELIRLIDGSHHKLSKILPIAGTQLETHFALDLDNITTTPYGGLCGLPLQGRLRV